MKTVLCLLLLCLQLASSAQQNLTPGASDGPWQQESHPVTFTLVVPGTPSSVNVAGSFNGWNTTATPMKKKDQVTWTATLPLSPGVYAYKFVINGSRWLTDSAAPVQDDGNGNINSVLVVKPAEYERLPGVVGDDRITLAAVQHERAGRFVQRIDSGHLILSLRTRHDDIRACRILLPAEKGQPQQKFAMTRGDSDALFDYWRGTVALPLGATTLRYAFLLEDGASPQLYDTRNTAIVAAETPHWFGLDLTQFPPFAVPDWVHDAVFYQIFPDRFANGDLSNDGKDSIPWGGKPSSSKRMGGDLKGIADHMRYLQDLGVNALYLTPIFSARSSHGYDTTDYHQIDRHFGTSADLKELTSSLHLNGYHILLDGVFNHTGVDFAGFKSLETEGEKSAYKDWYFVQSFPVNVQAGQTHYTGWFGIPWMPKLNVDNPATRTYLLDVGARWIRDAHIDGWRLDAADEVNHHFWQDFRKTVRKANPSAFLVGEIWGNAHDWLQGDQFDSVMNYRFRGAVLDFFIDDKASPSQFDTSLARVRADYPPAAAGTMFNILGSHDTERIRTLSKKDWPHERQAVLFQLTYPGVPCIYYGDEIGLEGGRDPDNRRAMPWEPGKQDQTILAFYKRLLALRRSHAVLRRGDYHTLIADNNTATFGFLRTHGKERVAVFFNRSPLPQKISLTAAQIGAAPLTDWLHGGLTLTKQGDKFTLTLPGRGIAVLGTL